MERTAGSGPPCRFCGTPLVHVFADLGVTPLANAYLRADQLQQPEPTYPLKAFVCGRCFLVQLEAFAAPEAIFGHYAYFSSYSETLLAESQAFADSVSARLGMKPGDRVVEIASNDGYLLQYFLRKGMDVLGVEPAANIAEAARAKGVATVCRFFGAAAARELAAEGPRARLLVANNVMAHVPDLNDFVAGLAILLAPGGTLSVEFHHVLRLIAQRQFDTIYHEHFQYFSLGSACDVLAAHGLIAEDVEELAAQGGSLRVYARHREDAAAQVPGPRVRETLANEEAAGLRSIDVYLAFSRQVGELTRALPAFLSEARNAGRSVVCYGAAAKGNTLLNACGIGPDLVAYAVDRSPHKQGLFLPGSHIPIHHPDKVRETRPDYLLILPWNLRDEIVGQMSYIREWGGQFVVPIPELRVLP
jgi:SAM-dependent methyltransferase